MLGLPAQEAVLRAQRAGKQAILVPYRPAREIPGADEMRVVRVREAGGRWELTVSPFKTRL